MYGFLAPQSDPYCSLQIINLSEKRSDMQKLNPLKVNILTIDHLYFSFRNISIVKNGFICFHGNSLGTQRILYHNVLVDH